MTESDLLCEHHVQIRVTHSAESNQPLEFIIHLFFFFIFMFQSLNLCVCVCILLHIYFIITFCLFEISMDEIVAPRDRFQKK